MSYERIPIIENNIDKYNNYKYYINQYNKAKKNEFYLQCLWILYALIEDRTSAFLYYIGFTSEENRTKVTHSQKIRKDIRIITNMNEKEKFNFDKLNCKFNKIIELIKWSNLNETDSDYQKYLKSKFEKYSYDEKLIEHLNYLNDTWRDKRNQIMHALFNKKYDAVNEELEELVNRGYESITYINKKINQIKRYNIRNTFRIR